MSIVTAARLQRNLSPLRHARAAAVAEQLARSGRVAYLNNLRAKMRFRGFTNAQVERAVDDLAEAGWVTIGSAEHGGLVIRLRGAA